MTLGNERGRKTISGQVGCSFGKESIQKMRAVAVLLNGFRWDQPDAAKLKCWSLMNADVGQCLSQYQNILSDGR